MMPDEQDQIRDFLLGHLPPAAAEAFESRLFLEEDLYDQVEESKFALADDFASGALSSEDARRFRELCNLSPALQQMVDDSQRLRIALANHPASQKQRWFRFSMPVFATALAVAAFLLVAIFFFRKREQPPPQMAALPRATPANVPATSAPPVFFLADLATRGPKDIPALSIAPATSQINLQLELKGRAADIPDWRLELIGNGQATPLAEQAHTQHAGPIAYLLCPVPTTSLSDGQYSIRLTPLTPGTSPLTRAFKLTRSAGRKQIPTG